MNVLTVAQRNSLRQHQLLEKFAIRWPADIPVNVAKKINVNYASLISTLINLANVIKGALKDIGTIKSHTNVRNVTLPVRLASGLNQTTVLPVGRITSSNLTKIHVKKTAKLVIGQIAKRKSV